MLFMLALIIWEFCERQSNRDDYDDDDDALKSINSSEEALSNVSIISNE